MSIVFDFFIKYAAGLFAAIAKIGSQLWPYVKKYKKQIMVVLTIIVISGLAYWQYVKFVDEINYWKAEVVKQHALTQINETLYVNAVAEVKEITLTNENLKKELLSSKKDVIYYTSLVAKYERELGIVHTTPSDTVYVDSNGVVKEKRLFNYDDGELCVTGNFLAYAPYDITFNKVSLQIELALALTQDKNGMWTHYLETNSKYLKPSSINVQIKARATPWEFLLGADIYGSLKGIGINAGIKKGNYSARVGLYDINKELMLGFGITKYWEF